MQQGYEVPSYGPVRSRQRPSKLRRKFTLSHLDDSDQAILAALEERPFSSVRELAGVTCLPCMTVHRRVNNSLGFILRHLRWVS
jgi:hypothetical protein